MVDTSAHLRGQVSRSISDQILEMDSLIEQPKSGLSFPPLLEQSFQIEMSDARARRFANIGIIGIIFYNVFLVADFFVVADIFFFAVIMQLAVVTPAIAVVLRAMLQRRIDPAHGVTGALIAVFGSIMVLLAMSRTVTSFYLIFTVPLCLAFGNVVLPLPFKMSVWFTALCIGTSSIGLLFRFDWNAVLSCFAVLVNVNSAVYMLIGTYRMEVSERRAYLFNRRERLRAELLVERNHQLQNLSETDSLTGLVNRRYLDAELARLCEQTARSEPFSLLLMDIDHFKKLNDTFGHDAGDHALTLVSRCLRDHAPSGAIVARYGGEEFVVLLPQFGLASALSYAETTRAAVERLGHGTSDHELPMPVTVSIGLISVDSTAGLRSSALIKAADTALYRAKANGRNRVEHSTTVVTATAPWDQKNPKAFAA